MVSHFKLWTDSAQEARKSLLKSHKKDFDGKMILIQKTKVPKAGKTAAEKKKHASGHLWYLETHKLYSAKKAAAAKNCKPCKK
jgi:hypothetical protein